MATIPELQTQIDTYQSELVPLQAAALSAQIKANQAAAALAAAPSTPDITDLLDAKNAAAADPTNTQLQQAYADVQSQWNAKQAVYLPLLKASDDAQTAYYQANGLVVSKESQITDAEVEIAQIDPTQASPEILQYMKEMGILPISSTEDTQPETIQNSAPATIDLTSASVAEASPNPNLSTVVPDDDEQDDDNPEPVGYPVPPMPMAPGSAQGLSTAVNNATTQSSQQNQQNTIGKIDWRVRLSLAPGAKYLYAGPTPGILTPLIATQGVIFPYTPSIQVNYAASYDTSDLTHSNYKIFQYKSSSVDNIQITCDFTAQDTNEANYVLAVIHFFRSMTKMFYGQDQNPVNGTPPPLCYITGLGAFQFDNHPLAITGFNYSLPTDVDYIQAGNAAYVIGTVNTQSGSNPNPRQGSGIATGGNPPGPNFQTSTTGGNVTPTYIPTKISLSISAIPVVSRNDISNRFSLQDYASGALLRGSQNNGAGIW